jgi:hypothetical protein
MCRQISLQKLGKIRICQQLIRAQVEIANEWFWSAREKHIFRDMNDEFSDLKVPRRAVV